MKKLIPVIMLVFFILSLCACSDGKTDDVIDASAYHITGDVPESIKKLSIREIVIA